MNLLEKITINDLYWDKSDKLNYVGIIIYVNECHLLGRIKKVREYLINDNPARYEAIYYRFGGCGSGWELTANSLEESLKWICQKYNSELPKRNKYYQENYVNLQQYLIHQTFK